MARNKIDDISKKIEDGLVFKFSIANRLVTFRFIHIETARGPRKRVESGSLRRKFAGGNIHVQARHHEDRGAYCTRQYSVTLALTYYPR